MESPADVRTDYLRRLGDAWNVLGDARTIVENGWLQSRWEFLPAPRTDDQPFGRGWPHIHLDGVRACVVTAVVWAAQRRDPAAASGPFVAGPALDFVWDALQESRGLGEGGAGGRSAPHALRLARIRDLTRWNDHPGRTQDEVLALLDLAQSRVLFTASAVPSPPR
jgi:hypothetical protein